MFFSSATNSVLNNIFSNKNGILYKFVLCLTGTAGLAISSQINIPLQPVPTTLQTAVVLFIAMIYGWRLGGCTVALYLLEGACGLPVFTNFSFGMPILLGPTGGYLLGFVPAVIATGWIIEKCGTKNIFNTFLAGIVGSAVILICGWIILASFVEMQNAYLFGVRPFLLTELIKLAFVVWLVPKFLCHKQN